MKRHEAGKKYLQALAIVGMLILSTVYIAVVSVSVDYVQNIIKKRNEAAQRAQDVVRRKEDDAAFRSLYIRLASGSRSHLNQARLIALASDQGTYDQAMGMLSGIRDYAFSGQDDWARIKGAEFDDYLARQAAIKQRAAQEVLIVYREITPEFAAAADKLKFTKKHELGEDISKKCRDQVKDAASLVASEQAELTVYKQMNKLYVQYARGIVTGSVFDRFIELYTSNLNKELTKQQTLRGRLRSPLEDSSWKRLASLLEDKT